MTFAWVPSYQSPKKTKFRLLRNKFGDGYEQRVGDGINNDEESWNLVFNTVDDATATAINDYLKVRKTGESFPWVPPFLNPGAASINVICTEYQINPSNYDSYDITATFEKVNGE